MASPDFGEIRERYVRHVLSAFPVVSTFLGGDGWSPELIEANGRLRDYGPAALRDELAAYREFQTELAAIDAGELGEVDRIDLDVIAAQLSFVIHQIGDRRYHERAVDTYTSEPQRAVDRQLVELAREDGEQPATEADWSLLSARLRAIPPYLEVARANLREGLASGNVPDRRLVERDGVAGSRVNEAYFRTELPALAARYLDRPSSGRRTLGQLADAAAAAADAYREFAEFLAAEQWPVADRFAIGELEYEGRVRDALRIELTADELWAHGAAEVASYQERMVEVAAELDQRSSLGLRFATPGDRRASVRGVIAFLARQSPGDDDELMRWYAEAGERAVAYGRREELFAVPPDYRLEVLPTPPILRSTMEAALEPAPPLRGGGVGRFFVTPTGNDPSALALRNRASIADMAVHEGFPGHDWHYRFMAERGPAISPVRWLTPGAVDDSSAMWADSMALEGWGLYAEELMATPGDEPHGFYDAAEYLYELMGQLVRAVRVRVDVGLHTGRLGFDEAVDYIVANQEFMPEARARTASDPSAAAVVRAADRAAFRYSKWPTQAITYNLGKVAILELRGRERAALGARFDLRRFHERLLGLGPIPPGYLRSAAAETARGVV